LVTFQKYVHGEVCNSNKRILWAYERRDIEKIVQGNHGLLFILSKYGIAKEEAKKQDSSFVSSIIDTNWRDWFSQQRSPVTKQIFVEGIFDTNFLNKIL